MKSGNILVGFLFVLLANVSSHAQPGTIRGKVTDYFTGRGIVDVTVGAGTSCTTGGVTRPQTIATTMTNADGQYELNYPDPLFLRCSPFIFPTVGKPRYAFAPNSGTNFIGTDRALGFVSAASFQFGVTPEMPIAAFGNGLAESTEAATSLPLPTTLANRKLMIETSPGNEAPVDLLFVSPTQINFVLPENLYSAVRGRGLPIKLVANGQTLRIGWPGFTNVAPGLFSANADGTGVAAAVVLRVTADNRQSYEPVARFDAALNRYVPMPIDLGNGSDQVFLVLFGSGWRNYEATPYQTIFASFGGDFYPVAFAGASPTLPGVDQINVPIPSNFRGPNELRIKVAFGGRLSNLVTNEVTIQLK